MTEVTRRASTIVEDLELWLSGGRPNYPRIAAVHGWPNVAAVRENIALLKPLGDLTVTFDVPPTQEKPVTQPATVPQRPAPPSTQPRPPIPRSVGGPVPDPEDTLTGLLRAGREHDLAGIRKQAEKIDALLAALRLALQADADHAARRKEIADLEARLAELKATAGFPCGEPGCKASFDTKQGASMHRTRAHRTETVPA